MKDRARRWFNLSSQDSTQMNGFMEVSGVQVITKTLSLCDFSSAKPLLKLIVDAYCLPLLKIPLQTFIGLTTSEGPMRHQWCATGGTTSP